MRQPTVPEPQKEKCPLCNKYRILRRVRKPKARKNADPVYIFIALCEGCIYEFEVL